MQYESVFNSKKMTAKRRYLRNKTTIWEKKLWERIRNNKLGTKFKRQYSLGVYIVDFYSPEKQMVVEIDGEIHKNQDKYDQSRTNYFKTLGVRVIRFWNSEIEIDIDVVVSKINDELKLKHG